MSSSTLDLSSPALRTLLSQSFSATLHRLRGVRNLLAGWALMGPSSCDELKLQARLEEDRVLLARLSWIHQGLMDPLSAIDKEELPRVLLAALLGFGTPEESEMDLPQILDPQEVIAICTRIQTIASKAPVDFRGHRPQLCCKKGNFFFELPKEWATESEHQFPVPPGTFSLE
ncbi:MAG: hypothetical protein QGH51_06940 [Planctomycetota bacterium]|nr:hypothetical protein [Planctomycetota bacterium]